MSKTKVSTPKVVGARKLTTTMTKEQVNAKYNLNVVIPAKIRTALDQVGAAAIKPKDLADLADVSTAQLAAYEEEFGEFLVAVKEDGRSKVLWTGDAQFAQELRESLAR